jgi:hypothetical protein
LNWQVEAVVAVGGDIVGDLLWPRILMRLTLGMEMRRLARGRTVRRLQVFEIGVQELDLGDKLLQNKGHIRCCLMLDSPIDRSGGAIGRGGLSDSGVHLTAGGKSMRRAGLAIL